MQEFKMPKANDLNKLEQLKNKIIDHSCYRVQVASHVLSREGKHMYTHRDNIPFFKESFKAFKEGIIYTCAAFIDSVCTLLLAIQTIKDSTKEEYHDDDDTFSISIKKTPETIEAVNIINSYNITALLTEGKNLLDELNEASKQNGEVLSNS